MGSPFHAHGFRRDDSVSDFPADTPGPSSSTLSVPTSTSQTPSSIPAAVLPHSGGANRSTMIIVICAVIGSATFAAATFATCKLHHRRLVQASAVAPSPFGEDREDGDLGQVTPFAESPLRHLVGANDKQVMTSQLCRPGSGQITYLDHGPSSSEVGSPNPPPYASEPSQGGL